MANIESRVGVSWIYSVLIQGKNYLFCTNCVAPEKNKDFMYINVFDKSNYRSIKMCIVYNNNYLHHEVSKHILLSIKIVLNINIWF